MSGSGKLTKSTAFIIAATCTLFALVAVTSFLFIDPADARSKKTQSDVIDNVLKLLKSDVDEEVVIAYIKKHGPPGEVTADQIVELKKAGATKNVLLALMGGTSSDGYPFDIDSKHAVKAPVTHGVLAVYPILRKGPSEIGDYLTLDEANARKVITIREQGNSGSVPVVIIRNNGRVPIYISAGEIIIGGKQDRMVAYDILIKPGREMTVNVRCVEQGRWAGQQMGFKSAKAFAGSRARSAVQFKGQGQVWAEVAAQNAAAKVRSSSGTLQATLNDKEVQKKYQEHEKAILPSLEGRNVVGMVVAINGEVISMDIFANASMFSRVKSKLLKAAVLDTLGQKDKKKDAPGKKEILAFYKEVMEAQKKELKRYKDNRNYSRESKKSMASESLDADGNLLHRYLRLK